MELYMENDLSNKKAQKILARMQKMKAINNDTLIEFCCGNILLGSLSMCLLGTDKSIVSFHMEGIFARINVYPYSTITGVSVGKRTWTEIILSIGGAQTATITSACTLDEGNKIAELILNKINY